MKILFVCENYLPYIGGAEVVFKNLAEKYVQLGHEVTILTHRLLNTSSEEVINKVKVVRVKCFNSRYLFTFFSLWKAIVLAKKHDLIQTTSFNGAPSAWLSGKITKRPVIITVHEVWIGKWKEVTDFSWWKSLIHEFLEKAIYKLPYNYYVCVSEATKKQLEKLSLDQKKIKTIYNGFDYEFWDKTKVATSDIRRRLGLANQYIYLSWGRPAPTKGFDYLLRAFPKISSCVPEAHLVLMLGYVKGYEMKRNELLSMVKELNIQQKVTVIESLTDEDKRNLIAAADCVIIPSTSEGFGYTTVEANSLGTMVVASDAGSIPEVISGKHLIFKKRNINDLAEKAVMAFNGQFEFIDKKYFDWDTSVKEYLNLYQEMLKISPGK